MFAKINHLAICTTNYATNARFYQALDELIGALADG